VLLSAIRDGVQAMWWERETFAYAESYDAERKRYLGLKAGQQVQVTVSTSSVLVKPEVAAAQIAADEAHAAAQRATISQVGAATAMTYAELRVKPNLVVIERQGTGLAEPTTALPTSMPVSPTPATPQESQFHRFYGSVKINPRMMAKDAGSVMQEVVTHLTALYGAKVQVTLEIQADIPGGVTDDIVRTVTENCRTLKFESAEFEEE